MEGRIENQMICWTMKGDDEPVAGTPRLKPETLLGETLPGETLPQEDGTCNGTEWITSKWEESLLDFSNM